MPVFLLWGEEEFNIKNKIQELKTEILGPDQNALNYRKLNEPDLLFLSESLQYI